MTYSDLAPYYDLIMNHVNYKEWLNLIQKLVNKYQSEQKISIFEIGAGTGSLGKLLLNSGYNYQASDHSFDMLRIANKKLLSSFCADARDLPLKKKYNVVLFLYDGINYLKSLYEYRKTFLSVASILKQDGLFLFDITTKTNSIKYFFDQVFYDEYDNVSIIRHSYYLPGKCLQCNDFTFFIPQKVNPQIFEKKRENHQQKLFDPLEIKQAIPKNLFNCIGIWDGFSQHRFNKQSERIHFLLKRI